MQKTNDYPHFQLVPYPGFDDVDLPESSLKTSPKTTEQAQFGFESLLCEGEDDRA